MEKAGWNSTASYRRGGDQWETFDVAVRSQLWCGFSGQASDKAEVGILLAIIASPRCNPTLGLRIDM
jgi:hypothetical protein